MLFVSFSPPNCVFLDLPYCQYSGRSSRERIATIDATVAVVMDGNQSPGTTAQPPRDNGPTAPVFPSCGAINQLHHYN